MNISDLITRNEIVVNLEATSKKQVLQDVAKVAAEKYEIDEMSVVDVVLEREKLGSTGLGKGIAIPHGRIDAVGKPVGVLVKLQTPVDFDAVDGFPVDIVFLLLAPVAAGADHLNALAAISTLLKDDATCEKIRAARTAEDITSLLGI